MELILIIAVVAPYEVVVDMELINTKPLFPGEIQG